MEVDTREWIGVDLDGTLAVYSGWKCDLCIGEPIQEMVERVKGWIANGERVKIMTARVGMLMQPSPISGRMGDQTFIDEQVGIIQAWTEEHIGERLEVTAQKDFLMRELWDDRAVQVVANTGKTVVSFWADLFRYIYERWM